MAKTLQELASELSAAFMRDKRNDGAEFVKLRDGSPSWMTDVCQAAHSRMFPDDHRYSMIEDAADALAEQDSEDEARDAMVEGVDVYYSRLASWLGSHTERFGYGDEALTETAGSGATLSEVLQAAQAKEREEVFGLVLDALKERASEEEDAEEEGAAEVAGDAD